MNHLRSLFRKLYRDSTSRVVVAVLLVVTILYGFRSCPSALRWPVRVVWFAILGWLTVMAWQTARKACFTWKKVLFSLVLCGFLYLMLAIVCQVFIVVMSTRDDRIVPRGSHQFSDEMREDLRNVVKGHSLNSFDPVLGWVPSKLLKTSQYTVNAQNIRSLHEYDEHAKDESMRFLCMGDSFTFGVAVGNEDTYPAQAEKLWPGSEWLNFGTPGGCLTQAYLRYHEKARSFGGKHVIIGFMTNDAQRTVNCFRPFVNVDAGIPLPKPFAKLTKGKLSIEPNPCQSIEELQAILDHESEEMHRLLKLDYLTWSGRQGHNNPVSHVLSYLYHTRKLGMNADALFDNRVHVSAVFNLFLERDPYGDDIWNRKSPGFQAVCALTDKFIEEIMADGRTPLFVIIPGPLDVENVVMGRPRVYATLVDYLKSKHHPFIDFLDPLVKQHKNELTEDALFVNKHYQPKINKELANEIISSVRAPQDMGTR